MTPKHILALATMLVAAVITAAPITTDSPDVWQLTLAEKRGQTLDVTDYSPEIGKLLVITLQPSVFPYLELYYRTPFAIATNQEEQKGVFSIDILADPAAPVQSVAVRLEDATGEIFQYRAPLKLRNGNWSTVVIAPDNPVSVWGGNNDKKIDFPVKFRGITVNANKNFTDPVKIHIDNIKWIPAETGK